MSKDEILDAISNLTVIELKELLDAFEEKFEVTAAAPVAVAAAGAPAGGGEAESEAGLSDSDQISCFKLLKQRSETMLVLGKPEERNEGFQICLYPFG